jgi:S-DNA-T family DNA segregation ATPase FtsK/SpoIIIE
VKAELAPRDPAVLEGQVVSEPPRSAPLRVISVVARHEGTRAAGRNLMYIPLGAAVVTKRLWDSRTAGRYERWIRAAETSGNLDAALEWESRLAAFRKDRHERRVDMFEVPARLLLQLPKLVFSVFLILAGTGTLLAIATGHLAKAAVPVEVAARFAELVVIAVSVAWGPFLLAAPWVAAAALYWAGRAAAGTAMAPQWAATSAGPDTDVSIDETTITRALDALRIPQITGYLKEGVPMQYLTPCRRDGRGTHAIIRLPAGVPAERIARRRADLATGLFRLAKEVWPVTGDEAGILDLWIADKGALEEGAGPYPLLGDGFTDVFRGLPFGKVLRGDPIRVPVTGRNTICGGMPEQGKSSAARVIACGYALDITTELRILIPDTNFDFEVMERRCSRYVMGAEDEYIEQILGELEELKDEVQARGQRLVDHEAPEVTRQLASAGVGLHPMLVLLEEAHVAIQHKKHGKDISALLCDIVKLDRKRGIHLMVSTQAPTKDSMPRDVTRNCSNGIAFAVGDHVANDALLGQGAYAGGHRATELIPGTDRGTALVKGFSGQRSEIVQVHFLPVARGNDQVTPLIGRSLDEMARQGRGVPGSGSRPRAIESRDLLDDLDEVLGHERVKLRDAVGLLRALAPGWGAYRQMTAKQLGEQLADRGVRTVNSSGTPYLDPADLRGTIARLSTLDLDEE